MFTKVMKEELIAGLLKIFGNNISMIILYGSVARNEYTDESDIDIAIILKNEIDNKTKEQFINWSADMDIRYDRVFSIIDIKESNIQKWGDSLPFYRNVKKEGLNIGRLKELWQQVIPRLLIQLIHTMKKIKVPLMQ